MPESGPDQRKEFYELAHAVLRRASTELLECYAKGEPILLDPPHEEPANELVLASAVGFAGISLHGTLAVAVPEALLDLLSPLQSSAAELAYGDWIGELGNQLLGRIKNKLVPYGIDIRLGTPAVVEGRNLRLHAGGRNLIEQRIQCGRSVVCVWLDAVVSSDLRLGSTQDETAVEGSVQIF